MNHAASGSCDPVTPAADRRLGKAVRTSSGAPVRWVTLKVALARLAGHPLIGWAIAWLFGDVIPFHEGRVDLRGLQVPARNKAALFWGIYESAEYRFVRDYLSPALPVIELGSSLGAIASVIVRRLQPDQRLICVEANPRLPHAIERTLKRNAPHLQTKVINAAIGYGCSHVDFRLRDDNLCSSVEGTGDAEIVRVPCITLAELVSQLGDGDYQLVADIEGAEAALLLHDKGVLARCQVAILELHSAEQEGNLVTPDDLVDMLYAVGFQAITRYGPVVACRRQSCAPDPAK